MKIKLELKLTDRKDGSKMMKRGLAGWMCLALLGTLVCVPGKETAKAASQVTVASLDYAYSGTADVEYDKGTATNNLSKSKYGSKKKGYAFTQGSARLYASVCGTKLRKLEWSAESKKISPEYKMNGTKVVQPVMTAGDKDATVQWTKGTTPYFEVQLSTKGYKNLSFSAYVGASKKGPKDYALSYAVGSSTSFTKLGGSSAQVHLTSKKKMTQIAGTLPAETAGKDLVKIRVEITSMSTVDAASGPYLYSNPTKGEAAINHIKITGEKETTATVSQSAAKTTVSASGSKSTVKGKVKKLILNKKKLVLKKKKSKKLKVTVKAVTKKAAKAAKKKLKWSSSNKKIATVTKSGKVTGKKKGTATITVRYSKKIKAVCKVTVR